MLATGHLHALEAVLKFTKKVLEGQFSVQAEEIRQLTEDVAKARQALRQLKRSKDLAPLTDDEIEVLRWLYESTEHWKGGKMPEDWPEYDAELLKARSILHRLGAGLLTPEYYAKIKKTKEVMKEPSDAKIIKLHEKRTAKTLRRLK